MKNTFKEEKMATRGAYSIIKLTDKKFGSWCYILTNGDALVEKDMDFNKLHSKMYALPAKTANAEKEKNNENH